MSGRRFKDEGVYLAEFMETISAVCPKCQGHALVICKGYPGPGRQPARVGCQQCGFNETQSDTTWKGEVYGRIKQKCPTCQHRIEKRVTGFKHVPEMQINCPKCGAEIPVLITWFNQTPEKPHEPFFGLPLWFVGSVKGHELWAFNREHLAFIKGFIAADLREITPNRTRSVSNRLPKWMLDRKNRDDVLKAIERLERKIA